MKDDPNIIQETQKEPVVKGVQNVAEYMVKHPIKTMITLRVVSEAIERVVKAFRK